MWMHSAATGIYAKEVARKLRHNVESSFLCGLLHDVGRPIVLQALVDITQGRTDAPVPAAIAEAGMQEFHAEVGAMVVRRWNLADWLVEAVRHHHRMDLEGVVYRKEVLITRLADVLSHWALDTNATPADFPFEHRAVQELNIYADDLVSLLELREQVLEVTQSFV